MLKSLDIHGFKSFARAARLEFPPGITALVGPNGTGKTNVVDALRWSLGEQSIRDLRGQRGEDVIYAGPRRVLGAAEVSLTLELEGERGRWPEVCISRRLYRSGENEYLLNRRKARLKDVLEVMREAGIDGGRRVVVSQGMADSLLSATPLERRALIEQAAGLAGYRDRRDEARQKLSSIAQNTATIELVLAELEPRVRLLRRQARAVEERDEAIAKLRDQLIAWYGCRWQAYLARCDQVERDVRALANQRSAAVASVSRLEEEAEAALNREREWHRTVESATAALHMLERERDGARQELEYLGQRMVKARRTLEQGTGREERLRTARADAERRLSSARGEVTELQRRRALAERELSEIEGGLERLQMELDEVAAATSESRRTRDRAEQELIELLRRQEGLRGTMEDQSRRLTQLGSAIQQHQSTVNAVRSELDELAERLRAAAEAESHHATVRHQLETSARDAGCRLERLDRLHRRLGMALDETCATQRVAESTLTQLENEIGGGYIRTLKVSVGWERAIASALGDWASAGAGSQSALHLADLSSFLSWRQTLEHHIGERLHWADAEADGFPQGAMNPLAGTVLASGDDQAAALWQRIAGAQAHRIGSPPLQVVEPSGRRWSAVGIQQPAIHDTAARYLATRRRVVEVERRRARLARRLAMIGEAREVAAVGLQELEKAVRAAEASLDSVRARRTQVTEESDIAERKMARHSAERAESESELAGLVARMEETKRQIGSLAAAEDKAQKACEEATRACDGAERRLEDLRRQKALFTDESGARRTEIQVLVARESAQADRVRSAEADLLRLEAEDRSSMEERSGQAAEITRLEDDVAATDRRLERVEQQLGEASRRLTELRNRHPSGAPAQLAGGLRHESADLQSNEELREARRRLTEIISSHERALSAESQLKSEGRALREEITRELDQDPAELPAPAVSPGEEDIRRLRTRAMQYPDADRGVVTEYQELADRQKYLRQQLDDLNASAHNLEEIMRVTDREMRQRFASALASIGEQFSQVFRAMLGGGEAALEQIDEDGAIEVRARLPGRRSRSSAAFSGGERALVASSLLFGLLAYRPTPFCILDEVDASLDESNVDRYLAVLREISRRTQMIVVTHNRATMTAADVLYGLTMDDEGVSRVLSLRLDRYDAVV